MIKGYLAKRDNFSKEEREEIGRQAVIDEDIDTIIKLYFPVICKRMIGKYQKIDPGEVVYEFYRACKYVMKKYDPYRKLDRNLHSMIYQKTEWRCKDNFRLARNAAKHREQLEYEYGEEINSHEYQEDDLDIISTNEDIEYHTDFFE